MVRNWFLNIWVISLLFMIFVATSQAESQRPKPEYSFVVSCRVEPNPLQISNELPGWVRAVGPGPVKSRLLSRCCSISCMQSCLLAVFIELLVSWNFMYSNLHTWKSVLYCSLSCLYFQRMVLQIFWKSRCPLLDFDYFFLLADIWNKWNSFVFSFIHKS